METISALVNESIFDIAAKQTGNNDNAIQIIEDSNLNIEKQSAGTLLLVTSEVNDVSTYLSSFNLATDDLTEYQKIWDDAENWNDLENWID